ncbi:MAG: hypothetical protein JWN40_848, partial [Phycisphaerales bacterium]|nr:hypothetical protein [Phycisphaerales bacterium]
RRAAIPVSSITITMRVDVADGGVDADVAPNPLRPNDDLLVAGNTSYQLKAGASAAPWQKAWVAKELRGASGKAALGKSVRRCLDRKGRYVLVCFGNDPTGAQRLKAIENLRNIFRTCGYKSFRVDVWGQSTLAALIDPFPSIRLSLSDRAELPFLTVEDWLLDAQMKKPLHLGKAQTELVNQIRQMLRGTEVRHIRLIGEPGLGKTRLLLEALSPTDLAPAVLYVRHPEDLERAGLFSRILRADDVSTMILVVDDCAEKERASIWTALRSRSDRIRLVTLDHGPETSSDEWMRVVDCPALDRDQIRSILAEYVKGNQDSDRWADFCSGSPRVAHAVGENLRRNPEDILKSPAEVPIWERFIHGNSKSGSTEAQQKEVVLRHIALFQRFGYEKPVQDEATFIARLVEEADPTITWKRFQSIIRHFRDRRILQGKTTLFIVPRALHVHLWIQFWKHYGPGMDVAATLTRMPPSLFGWFTEMFKYGHASPPCLSEIERITSPAGPFDKSKFITSGPGATFLSELAEAHPEAALRCIERTVGVWSVEQLKAFNQHRHQIVSALEKLAMWKPLFRRAAAQLLRLAVAENSSYSNNATGTFCSLFAMGRDNFASSEASPAERFPSLRFAIESNDRVTRVVGFNAAKTALADHPYSKMVGPQYQGMRPVPKLWTPKRWGEIYDAYRATWRFIGQVRRSTLGDDKADACKVLTEAAFWLIQNRWIEAEVIQLLNEIISDPDTDLHEAAALVARYRRLNWRGMSRIAATGLRRIEKKLRGSTLQQQIRRATVLGSWDDLDDGEGSSYGKKHAAMIVRLVRSAMRRPAALKEVLTMLLSNDGFAIASFGHALGAADRQLKWWPTILNLLRKSGVKRNPQLASGYLSAVCERSRDKWETEALALIADPKLKAYTRQLVVASGLSDILLDAICAAITKGDLTPEAVQNIDYYGGAKKLAVSRWLRFIEWCVAQSVPPLVRTALELAHSLFCIEKEAPELVEQPVLSLLCSPAVFAADESQMADYQWQDLTTRFVKAFPSHARQVFESVLDHFGGGNFALGMKFSQAQKALDEIIKEDPRGCWEAIEARLTPVDNPLSHGLLFWLGPRTHFGNGSCNCRLSLFDVADVMRWVEEDGEERARVIARYCPKTLAPNEGGELTRHILIEYGSLKEVRSALSCNFATDGWSGNASDHYRQKRDRMRGWLTTETALPVIEWVEHEIDDLNEQIAAAEINEERRY